MKFIKGLGFVLGPHAVASLLSWTRVGWSGPSQSIFSWSSFSPPPSPFSSSLGCAVPGQVTLKGEDPARRALHLPWLDKF